MEEEQPVYRKDVNDKAIEDIQSYFDKHGLTLYERWHVCVSYEMACLAAMAEHLRELCLNMRKEATKDIKSIVSR